MHKYTVDVAALLCGRTLTVHAHTAKDAYRQVRQQLNLNRFEKIVQIRDDDRLFYYDCENGFYGE